MKKLMACLLAVCLLSGVLPAFAATPITDYTLEEKWDLQMQGSGFKGNITFQVEGDAAFGVDAMTWQGLKMLLPQLTVNMTSAPRSDNRETTVNILQGDAVKGSVHVLTDGSQYVLQSDLIHENSAYYAFLKEFDWSFLMQSEGEIWPSVWPMLLSLMQAEEAWKTQTEDLASPFMTDLAMWMQSYMAVTAETENEDTLTRMYCEIPAAEVKQQMKKMLANLYQDEALLTALQEVFSARESAAYLNGSMLDTFATMLDLLEMDGHVIIDRLYDTQGNALLDSISLPFAATEKVKQLTIAITPDGAGEAITISGLMQDDRAFQFIAHAQDDGVVKGSVQMDVLAETAEETAEAEVQLLAFDFHLIEDEGEETYDLENDLCAHAREWTLVMTAGEKDTTGMHDMSLSIRSDMTSKSSRRAVTYIAAECTLKDQTQGSALTVTLNCNTAAPWTPMTIAELTEQPEKLDDMEQEALLALKTQWKTYFESWLSNLMMESFAATVQ